MAARLSHPVARQKVKRNWEKAALTLRLLFRPYVLCCAPPNNTPGPFQSRARLFSAAAAPL